MITVGVCIVLSSNQTLRPGGRRRQSQSQNQVYVRWPTRVLADLGQDDFVAAHKDEYALAENG